MAYFKVVLLFLSPHPLSPSNPLFLPLSFYSLFPFYKSFFPLEYLPGYPRLRVLAICVPAVRAQCFENNKDPVCGFTDTAATQRKRGRV